jgi:hypothetical protein
MLPVPEHRAAASCRTVAAGVGALLLAGLALLPQGEIPAQGSAGATVARVFFQDHAERALRWTEVRLDGRGRFSLARVADVPGFKKLDIEKQKLVQMAESRGLLLVGVRDEQDGAFESGWILVHTGVRHEDHGDHAHWIYKNKPLVLDSRLDQSQGNPAHLYVYDGVFYLANDRNNGYTRLDPRDYHLDNRGQKKLGQPVFIPGGGNHITLAVVENKVGYSCWIDGGGPNQGRVDVTPVTGKIPSQPAYSFHLPSGAIHGAIANSGKVFFAPADGICWVQADPDLKLKPDEVRIHHIPLGTWNDKPLRTGAFVNHGRYVVFVTGREASSALVLLDARSDKPQPIVVPIECRKENRLVSPAVITTRRGQSLAFVFHDHERTVEADDYLTVVDLDPNRDGVCSDAKVLRTMKVGPSLVDGHYGHHDIAFDADRRWAFFTNPGSGTLAILDLEDLTLKAEFPVGGVPTHIVAVGGMETAD